MILLADIPFLNLSEFFSKFTGLFLMCYHNSHQCAFAGAVASSEVKQRLHEFVLQKKQRESMSNINGYGKATSPVNNNRDW